MSQWHNEHPELTGTESDPWMMHVSYRQAVRDVAMIQQFPNLDAMIDEVERAGRCLWCGSDDTEPVDEGEYCKHCESTSQREE